MELSEERIIRATPAQVFAALNDPVILQKCIPGCDHLEKLDDHHLQAQVSVKIGPVNAKFSGQVTLSDVVPPERLTLQGQGQSAAGGAKGQAHVILSSHADGTSLKWDVSAQISGKIAQLGSRLVNSVAKSLANQFFQSLAECLEEHQQDHTTQSDPHRQVSRGGLSSGQVAAVTGAAFVTLGIVVCLFYLL